MRRTFLWLSLAGQGLALAVWLYARSFAPWQRGWGATAEERSGPLIGDEYIERPAGQATRAITVNARPDHIWPWLVQMGHGRGGFFSWDFLDIVFQVMDGRSSKRVLPEFQDLRAGDAIPVKRGPAFPVLLVHPGRALVLGSGEPSFPVTWQTELRPLDETHTRIITRSRLLPPPGLRTRILVAVLDLAAFVMVRRWLQVLKERGEGLAAGKYA
jgi:hypothetical protein